MKGCPRARSDSVGLGAFVRKLCQWPCLLWYAQFFKVVLMEFVGRCACALWNTWLRNLGHMTQLLQEPWNKTTWMNTTVLKWQKYSRQNLHLCCWRLSDCLGRYLPERYTFHPLLNNPPWLWALCRRHFLLRTTAIIIQDRLSWHVHEVPSFVQWALSKISAWIKDNTSG